MRALAAIAMLVLGSLAAPPAFASPAQDAYGVTQARNEAPALDGEGLVVAVVDTGVDATHPALAGRVIESVDLSPPPSMQCPDFGHGTWVAGIIAGAATGSLPQGVAPEAEIVSVKVVNNCHESSLQHIADGIDWVIDNPQHGIDVVNLSIGDKTPSGPDTDVAEAAVDRAVADGLTVVTAAGNEPGLGMVATPASAERAITVGAMTDPLTPALLGGPGFRPSPFSSGGPVAEGRVKPDLMAAAAHLAAGTGTTGRTESAGTSGAAAFTSGVALLMLDANPALGPEDVKERMIATAHDWGRPGVDEDYGAGRLDAYAALKAAGAPLSTPPAGPEHRIFPGRAAVGAPVVHEVVVTDDGTPLAATLLPDPPDRLPAGAAVELDLRLEGPGGVDETDPMEYRRRSVALADPEPGTYTLTVSAAAGAASYALDVSGALGPGGSAPDLALDPPPALTSDATPAFTGHAGSALGDLPGVAARIYRNGVQVRSLWALPAAGGDWSTEPATELPDGTYQIGAEQGSAGGTPARTDRLTFTIDTVAPDTTITGAPPSLTNDPAAGVQFTADEPGEFQCRLNGGDWTACTSPHSFPALSDGQYTADVRAIDEAGNTGAAAVHTWTVDTAPPETTLTQSGTTFTFGSEPGARFECSDDGRPWAACASPVSRAGLPPGPHSLAVRAVDAAGNADPTPESTSWTVAAPRQDPPPASPDPPPASPAPPEADTDAPEVTLAGVLKTKLALLRRRGLLLRVRCDDACTVRAELRLTRRLARRLRLPKRLAKAAGELAGAGSYELRLRPSPANRARLRRVRSLKLTIVVVATDAAGNEDRLSRPLKLR